MADWNLPTITTAADTTLDDLLLRDVDAFTMGYSGPTNPPAHAIRWNRSTNKFQEYDGAAWADLLTSGGLGTMSTQNSDAVSITGGTIGGTVDIDATRLTSGTVPTARQGSGTASQFTALHGDQTWKPTVPIGTGAIWFTVTAPTGWLLLNGQAVNRVTYATLFALWSTTFGVGDGSTTFNVPDLRGYFPFGKAASGTGSTLNGTFGSIDHTHTSAAHTHTMANHTHTGPSHTHNGPSHSHTFGGSGDTSSDGLHGHTGTTSAANIAGVLAAYDGGGSYATEQSHSHTFSSDLNGTHTHTVSVSGTTDAGGTGATGASGTGATSAPSTNTSDSTTPGVTGTNNPPGFAVNFIVRAL